MMMMLGCFVNATDSLPRGHLYVIALIFLIFHSNLVLPIERWIVDCQSTRCINRKVESDNNDEHGDVLMCQAIHFFFFFWVCFLEHHFFLLPFPVCFYCVVVYIWQIFTFNVEDQSSKLKSTEITIPIIRTHFPNGQKLHIPFTENVNIAKELIKIEYIYNSSHK